ncbi:hypothetical protein BH11PLA2_BH11PLA2_12030 [soil metagenome]
MKTLTRADCREIDRRAMSEFGVPSLVLMENAGRSAAELMMELNGDKQTVIVVCGKGNNGGDGFVMADYLNEHDWYTYALLVDDPNGLTPEARHFHDQFRRNWPKGPTSVEYVPNAWYVDALFGTGLSRTVTGLHAEIIKTLNSYFCPILALDIPSGLDCDTGKPLGVAVKATHTATFVGRKRGFDNPASLHYTGEVHVIDIGAPRILVDQYIKYMDALAYLEKPPAKVPPVIALIGDEGFLVRRCREAIIKKLLDDADPEYALANYPGDKTDFTTIRNDLGTLPFLAPIRIVIIETADPFVTNHRESLEKYAAKPSKIGVLILEVKTFPEKTKLAKLLPDAGKLVCKAPKPEYLPRWCVDWAKAGHGKKLTADAAALLVDHVGPQMGLLAQEIDKLVTAVGSAAEITPEQVDKYVGRSRAANVFRIMEAIGEGKATDAMTVLSELFDEGQDPMAILGPLQYQLRKLAAFERHLGTGLPAGPAMDAAGVPKWPQARNSFDKQVRHLGRRRLQQLTKWMIDIQTGLKGGNPLPGRLQMERLVTKLASAKTQ